MCTRAYFTTYIERVSDERYSEIRCSFVLSRSTRKTRSETTKKNYINIYIYKCIYVYICVCVCACARMYKKFIIVVVCSNLMHKICIETCIINKYTFKFNDFTLYLFRFRNSIPNSCIRSSVWPTDIDLGVFRTTTGLVKLFITQRI